MNTDTRRLINKSLQIRRMVLEMISRAGKGHIGGAFSCADLLVSLYYGGILRHDPRNPAWEDRDRFILSKGHSAATLFAVLSDLGYFPASELANYQKQGCLLGGHPDKRIPAIEADTGSLGHGLGIAAGMALGAKMSGRDFMTVSLLGDGECCEGSVWEAAMFAGYHKLNNLACIIDNNGICSTDFLSDCAGIEPLEDKWKAFGWDTMPVNGHDFEEIIAAFSNFRKRVSGKPLMIIARTVKGKGVSFMENNPAWHHGVPGSAQYAAALKELEGKGGEEL